MAGISAKQPIVVNATFLSPKDPTLGRQLVETIKVAQGRSS
jgi:hypothetical protein